MLAKWTYPSKKKSLQTYPE
jgi:hypothetical protein